MRLREAVLFSLVATILTALAIAPAPLWGQRASTEVELPQFREVKFTPDHIVTGPGGRLVAVKGGLFDVAAGRIPDGFAFESAHGLDFSVDGAHAAISIKTPEGWVPVVDGKRASAFKPYEDVMSVFLTPDGARVLVLGKVGKKQVLNIDGQEGKAYDEIFAPQFDPTGKNVAHRVKVGKSVAVVTNGQEGKLYDDVKVLEFSENLGAFQYVGVDEKSATAFVVVDGKETKTLPYPNAVKRISDDLRHYAYVTSVQNKKTVVLDGAQQPPYEDIAEVAFSPDGSRLAYVAKSNGRWVVVVDGKEQKAYDSISGWMFGREVRGFNGLTFSPDSKRLMYVAQEGKMRRVVIDGKEEPLYDFVHPPGLRFSPDSSRTAYFATKMVKGRVQRLPVVDGQEGHAYDEVWEVAFSPDSKRVVTVVLDGSNRAVMVDGKPRAVYSGLIATRLHNGGFNRHIVFDSPGEVRFFGERGSSKTKDYQVLLVRAKLE